MSDRLPFNLLTDRWLPVRRLSGAIDTIAPHEIAADTPDPVVSLEWPRPDFRLAATEFLIGLLATFCPPETTRDWTARYRTPPSTEDLQAAFAPYAHAFALDGPGPRFMQDLEDFAGEPNGVASLLIDAPGENTVKRNTDLMVRRGGVCVMSRGAAAMALYTLQTYAPSGGAGNRTSLRGGGPLTTIALPPPLAGRQATLLWHVLWANVPVGPPADAANLRAILPWLAATRLSDKAGRATTPHDVHPLQAWWGMPRRIRLVFSGNEDRAQCDIGGQIDDAVVRFWRQRPWGTNYAQWGGLHPLSPCYRVKPTTELLYVHPQPGGIGYRHWLGLLVDDPGQALTRIAPAIDAFRRLVRNAHPAAPRWRLLAAGYDMDNMKARGFAESEMPVVEPVDPQAAKACDALVRSLVQAAAAVAALLARHVRRALFSDGATVAIDAANLAALRERFWDSTSDPFFAAVERSATGADPDSVRQDWLRTLSRAARALFHEAAPVDASGEGHPGRIADAARQLGVALAGYGKEGAALFTALGLPPPEATKPKRGKKEAAV
jgi:CRISPR system Cascade subunit CasA